MAALVQHFLARQLITTWLATSADSWRRHFVASDSPVVHAPGTNPDRVLLTGDGAATGRGVRSHELGLPGYLARSLSRHTGRAADVDIVVAGDMTAESCLAAISDLKLARFDIVVISVGANEALALLPVEQWRAGMTELLDHLDEHAPSTTEVFVLPIPFFGINPSFPTPLAQIVDQLVQVLNAATDDVVAARPRMTVVPVAQAAAFEPEGSHLYQRWAEAIALRISTELDPDRLRPDDTSASDEMERQQALERTGVLTRDADPVLDRLTETARQAFGTAIAAVTFIESDVQFMRSAVGIEPVTLPRDEAFCDITIRRDAHFVIEDASLDPRYSDHSLVTGNEGIRFYAGYPIEAPDGQRIGAVCVMDTSPRQFTAVDAQLLRAIAHTVQDHLWAERPDPR
jgi:GAF domain-containing protein